jgi:transcriptional regulator with XRE-family HTH domain
MAQYESGSRTPKADLTNNLAEVFGISAQALTVPDIDSDIGLLHTLFTLEDLYGMRAENVNGEIYALMKTSRQQASLFLQCLPLGQNRLKNTETVKSPKSSMMNGVIHIQSLIPHRLG